MLPVAVALSRPQVDLASLVDVTVPAFTSCFCLDFFAATTGRPVCAYVSRTMLARVAHVLLLHSVVSYRGSEYACIQMLRVDWKRSDCSKAQCNTQQVDLCVLASSSCRELRGSAGMQGRPALDIDWHLKCINCFYTGLLNLQ